MRRIAGARAQALFTYMVIDDNKIIVFALLCLSLAYFGLALSVLSCRLDKGSDGRGRGLGPSREAFGGEGSSCAPINLAVLRRLLTQAPEARRPTV